MSRPRLATSADRRPTRHRRLQIAAILLVTACAPGGDGDGESVAADVIQVEAPTGDATTDRARVQAAFDRVRPGGTVQFAPGTYLLGEGARLTVPDVTVLGHPDGTVLRGCAPEQLEFPDGPIEESSTLPIVQGCTGLFVMADRQTIRALTFEYAWHGIFVGTPPWIPPSGDGGPAARHGGHRIEDNVFRYTPNAVRVVGPLEEPTLIWGNEVLDAYHAFQGNGAAIHVVDNRVVVSDPAAVPNAHHPESAVILNEWGVEGAPCTGSRVERNEVFGTVNGIQILAPPGAVCSGHEIRDNVIRALGAPLPEGYPERLRTFFFGEGAVGSTVNGIAIRLVGEAGEGPDGPVGRVTDVVVEGNWIGGGSGLAIQLVGASGNRIVDNVVGGLRTRAPLPGLTWGDDPTAWAHANGSAIWVSVGSDGNHLEGNTFEELQGSAVHLDGSDNEVVIVDGEGEVVDRGRDNRIRRR